MNPIPEEEPEEPATNTSDSIQPPVPPCTEHECLRKTIYLRSKNKKKKLSTIIEEEITRTDSK